MFGAALIRFSLPLLFLLVTFWPDYGLAWLGYGQFSSHPYLMFILGALWSIVFSLLLPLPVKTFRTVSTVLLAAAILAATVMAFVMSVVPQPLTAQVVIFYLIAVLGVGLGWLIISAPVWRRIHGIVAVDTQPHHDHQ